MEKKNNQVITALILGVLAIAAVVAVVFGVIKPFGGSQDAGRSQTSEASKEDSEKTEPSNIFDNDTSKEEPKNELKDRLDAVKAVDLSKTDALTQEKAILDELINQAEAAVKDGDEAKAEPLIVHCENVQKALTGQSSGLTLGKVQQLVKGGLTVDAKLAGDIVDTEEPVFNVYEKAGEAKEYTWVPRVSVEKGTDGYKLSFTPTAEEDGSIKASYIVTCQGDMTYARAKADFTAAAAQEAKEEKEKDDSSEKEKESKKDKDKDKDKDKKEEKKEESSESKEESEASIETDTGDWSQMLYGTDTYYLVESDINYLTPWQLMIGRNEIYARHGRLFNDPEIQEYFNGKAWYKGYIKPEDFDDSVLSDVEKYNLKLIYEVEKGGSEPEPEPAKDSSYMISGSSDRYLTDSDVKGLSSWQLMIARNEIYARHGRKFNDSELQEYFNGKSWYNGTIAPENFNADAILSDIEQANLKLIHKYE
ncbi:MAG: YARHG domain-containing protein [Clostridiales bacterium]|nr:YARHG domain-containing protein [Clostridiales bacterium]